MTPLGTRVQHFRSRLAAGGDRGLTLVELMVTMLLSAILLGLVVTPFVTVTDVTGSAASSSQAAASARTTLADMSAGIASASEVCLPVQLTSTQTTTLGNAVRVKTDVFGTTKWEQWWLNPSTNQLLAQSWPVAAGSAPPNSWRTVANHVLPVGSSTAPFTIAPSAWVVSPVGPLPAGTYTTSGTTGDTGSSNVGTWSYSLYVDPTNIIQTSPTSGTVTAAGSASFTGQLAFAGNTGPVTFTTTASSTAVGVTSTGAITTTGTLAAGSYTISGTDSDSADTGTWTFTLYVGNTDTIVQTTPTSGVTTQSTSAAFVQRLGFAGNTGTVTYTQSGSTDLLISSVPGVNAPVVLTIAIAASSGHKGTGVSIPVTSAITTLDTTYAAGPGTCITGLG